MIFYAEDDPDDLYLFLKVIADLGKEAVTFTNVRDLMAQMKNPPPDVAVLFLDINIPVISGLQALELIRQSEEWKNLPVVILSEASNDTYLTESHFLGANLFIVKPHSYQKLKCALKYALNMDWEKHHVTVENFLYQPGMLSRNG